MSWPLASFLVVAAALLVGWLAYERSRPSARMVAVVASLAALTALGRDAFVALPDVKPITAMTFASGYALGPLPGFTIGALGMLASNILLGEGPYTPWQMVAWGGVGLLGALAGRLSRRRLNRLALGLACAAAALVAKEVMNVYVWTLGGIYTPAALLARFGEGLPFDLTDTLSSLLFGLAFAPELARLLGRVRMRMHVSWEPAGTVSTAVLALAVGAGALQLPLPAGTPVRAAVPPVGRVLARAAALPAGALSRAVHYLEGAQNPDGGFPGSPGERSSELYSAWAALGLASAGIDPAAARPGGHSVLESMRAEASTLESPADMERTMLALHAAGANAADLGGLDLEARMLAARRPDGSIGDEVNWTAFLILALRAAGRGPGDPTVRAAGRWVTRQQNPDGGFSYASRSGGGAASDVDDTGGTLQALLGAGLPAASGTIQRAVAYLRRTQNRDGGFPEQRGQESDAQSTAWAVQGLVAAGVDVEAVRRGGRGVSPLVYLERLQAPNGSIRYSAASAQSPVWVTAQVLPALAGRPLPIGPARSAGGSPVSGGATRATSATGGAPRAPGTAGSRRRGGSSGGEPEAARLWLPEVVGGVTRSLTRLGEEALGHVGVAAAAGASSSTPP